MFALDTNTLIYLFKGQGHVAEHLFSQAVDRVTVPAVVVYELEVGLAKSNAPQVRRRQLEELLAVVRVIPFGRDEAAAAARIRAKLERAGTPLGPMDTLIAGTALAHRATLVTRNRGGIFPRRRPASRGLVRLAPAPGTRMTRTGLDG